MQFPLTGTLLPRGPFDFFRSMQIFAGGDAQIQDYAQETFRQVVRIGTVPALLCVRSRGDIDLPVIDYSLLGSRDLDFAQKTEGGRKVTRILSLDVDLQKFYDETRGDPVLAGITRRLRGLCNPTTESVFEALVDTIIEQQISLQVAWGMQERLIRTCGESLQIGTHSFFAFPAPRRLAAASVDELRTTGLSHRKIEYIQGIARQVSDGGLDLEQMGEGKKTPEVMESLMEIRGIGRWTAELTLVRGMQRFDAFPADDLGLRRHIGRFYRGGKEVLADEARVIAEQWGVWKGLAGYYLIVADRPGFMDSERNVTD